MMDRRRLRELRAIREDLASRPGGAGLLGEADRLIRFYARSLEREDVLVGGDQLSRRRAPQAPKPKRQRPRKPTSADYILAILREAMEPLSANEIAKRLEDEWGKSLTRQAMSYVLNGLEREDKVERVKATEGWARHLWRAK